MGLITVLLCFFTLITLTSPSHANTPNNINVNPCNLSKQYPYIISEQISVTCDIDNFLDDIAHYNPLDLVEVLENLPDRATLRGSISFGYIHGHAHFVKQEIQQSMYKELLENPIKIEKIDKTVINKQLCSSPTLYTSREIPLGKVEGNKKYIMTQEMNQPESNCEHTLNLDMAKLIAGQDPNIQNHINKVGQFDFPIELEREFPTYEMKNFDLLDAKTPGFSNRSFEVTKQLFGDTLIKINPDGDRAYIYACQIFPGASLQNKNFTFEYIYLKLLNLSLLLNGRLGGVDFKALRFCTLIKVTHDPEGKKMSAVIDVDLPQSYELHRVPLDIKVAAASWLVLVILILILAALAAMLPGTIGIVLAVIFGVLALVVTVVGILSSSILTNFANQFVDDQIKNFIGINIDDLNKGDKHWVKDLVTKIESKSGAYQNLKFFAGKKPNSAGEARPDWADGGEKFDNGEWAYELLTKELLQNQIIFGQATVEASYESLMEEHIGEFIKDLRDDCDKIAADVEKIELPSYFQRIIEETHKEVVDVCESISATTVSFKPFVAREASRRAGCYDNYIRLEDVELGKVKMMEEILKRLDTGGGKFGSLVRKAIEEQLKINEESVSVATNWWAQPDSPNYCAFDVEVNVNMRRPRAKLLICLAKNIFTHNQIDTNLMISVFLTCDIIQLIDFDKIVDDICRQYENGVNDAANQMEQQIPELNELANRHPVLRKIVDDIKNMIPLIRNQCPLRH